MGRDRGPLPIDDNREDKLAGYCLEHASVCTFRMDQEGNILYANHKACNSLGYVKADLLEMSVYDIDPAMDRKRWPQAWKTLTDNGSLSIESQHRRKDGTIFPVAVTATLINFEGCQYCMALSNDITERKRVEDSLRLTQFIFDKAPFGIFLIRSGGDIINVNNHACRYLGYTREELCQMNVLEIDRGGYSPQEIEQIWLRQQQMSGIDTFETSHRRKDGTIIPVEINGILMEFDQESYSVSFVKDISERKEAEKHRAKMENHLREAQKIESLGTLAGGIAHDFNNILSAIVGYAELSKLTCPVDSTLRNYATQITKAGHRAKELTQQILLFSSQGRSEKGPTDVGRVVEEALKLIKASLPATIEIKANISRNLAPVVANETNIHQIMMNLCTNAYHVMKSAGGLLSVNLMAVTIQDHDMAMFPEMKPGNYLKLSIADNGCGIPPNLINRIFDPYFTTKATGEGTGLGLSITHGIVKDHGGFIKVYSEVGVGTNFHVFLPSADSLADTASEKMKQLPTGSGRILFVDDEKTLIELGRDLLGRLGYQVDTRACAIDALKAFRADPSRFDLIISDMTMPKMTGAEMARQMRAIKPGIPIILCSGFNEQLHARASEAIGVNAVLMKPVLYADLAHTVHRVLKSD